MQNLCAFPTEDRPQENQPRRRFVLTYIPDFDCVTALLNNSTRTGLTNDSDVRIWQESGEQIRETWTKRTQDCICHPQQLSSFKIRTEITSSSIIAQCRGVEEILVMLSGTLYRTYDTVTDPDGYETTQRWLQTILTVLAQTPLWGILVGLQQQAPGLSIKVISGKDSILLPSDICAAIQAFDWPSLPAWEEVDQHSLATESRRKTRNRSWTAPHQDHNYELASGNTPDELSSESTPRYVPKPRARAHTVEYP